MTACATAGAGAPQSDLCATQDQWVAQLIALLPRGRAWGTHDGGPYPGTVLYRFWYAVAGVLAWFEALACALILEFYCATTTTTGNRDLWMADYNLPDGCDPFPDLCTKVAALGGTRCDYITAVCARAGWAITCVDLYDACGARADGAGAMADCMVSGDGLAAGQMFILVSLSSSAAYAGGALTQPLADLMVADGFLACPPDLTGLECLLARIVGAHKQILYGTTT